MEDIRIDDLQKDLTHSSIAILGDLCLDIYYFLDNTKSEISLETGLPTNSVESIKFEVGGAANVAVNIRRLGAPSVHVYGIVGNDDYGKALLRFLSSEGVTTDGIVVQQDDWTTNVYHKIYDKQRELPRFDIGNFNIVNPISSKRLLDKLEEQLDTYRVVVINEQLQNGIHDPQFQDRLNDVIRTSRKRVLWVCDSRNLNDAYPDVIHKLNYDEGKRIYRRCHTDDPSQLKKNPSTRDILHWLRGHWKKPVVMTMGEEGALVIDDDSIYRIPGLHIVQPLDTVGAGDAFLAGFTNAVAAGRPLSDAARIGNFAAGVSITKLFETGHPTIDEVRRISTSPDYRYHPELAGDDRKAQYLAGTDVEIIVKKRTSGFPASMIFDHDGTISTLREGWEVVMHRTMVTCILGTSVNSVSAEGYKRVVGTVSQIIEKTTGVQTLIQMAELKNLVETSGYVPSTEVLSVREYKEIYNTALMKRVEERIALFGDGRISLDDVTIRGSLPFLGKMAEAGVTLYLASGTDIDDVRREADLLGYADLFEGRIFGSTGDVENDPKRVVMRRILTEMEKRGGSSDCVVFGDGPVEIREARKSGFTAVGILSDEVRRYGMNKNKRERLVLAGADYLIPDFTWIPELSAAIGWST